jgi:hypothetical protein
MFGIKFGYPFNNFFFNRYDVENLVYPKKIDVLEYYMEKIWP